MVIVCWKGSIEAENHVAIAKFKTDVRRSKISRNFARYFVLAIAVLGFIGCPDHQYSNLGRIQGRDVGTDRRTRRLGGDYLSFLFGFHKPQRCTHPQAQVPHNLARYYRRISSRGFSVAIRELFRWPSLSQRTLGTHALLIPARSAGE